MESKRLKTEALAKSRELIDDHPFELKSFKIGSLATTREFIDVHPFQSLSGAVYTAPIMNQAMSSSSTNMASPSNRPMQVDDTSRPQVRPSRSQGSRSIDEVDEQIEASRQQIVANTQRRRAAFKSIEQYWDYNHPCGHCGRVWLRGSSVGLRKKCCQGGRM